VAAKSGQLTEGVGEKSIGQGPKYVKRIWVTY